MLYLLDVHKGVGLALVEDIQRVFANIFCYAIGYLSLPWLANETAAHQAEGFLHMGNCVVLEEV